MIASAIAVLNINMAKDEKGDEIKADIAWTDSLTMCVNVIQRYGLLMMSQSN